MKKIFSIIIVAILLVAGIFILTGCGEKFNNKTDNNSHTKVYGDIKQSNDETSSPVIPVENSYDVKLEGNVVSVIGNLNGTITTTKYTFENDCMSKIETVQEYSSTELAKSTYEQMMATPQITEQYSNITLNGKGINLTTKTELVDALKSYTIQDFYETQKMTYGSI